MVYNSGMKKYFTIAFLIFCLCLPILCSGCLAIVTYNAVVETSSYDIEEDYNNIDINAITANITFMHSNTSQSKVFYNGIVGQKHSVEVVNGTLTISQEKSEEWYDQILNYASSYIVIHLNKIQYDSLEIVSESSSVEIQTGFIFNNVDIQNNTGDIKWKSDVVDTLSIQTQTGDLKLEDASFNMIKVNNDTGDVKITSCSASSHTLVKIENGNLTLTNARLNLLHAKINTGYAMLSGVYASDQIMLIIETGNIFVYSSDTKKAEFTTTTGDIFASFLSNKTIEANASSGQINIPSNSAVANGTCTAITQTGNITIDFGANA